MPRVLLVDDADDIRLLQRTVLTRAGFEVDEAANATEALAAIDRGPPPDAVVLDVQMPDLDGWATLAAIRSGPRSAHVPVVMCTVKAGIDDAARAWDGGCDGYLVKPFSTDRLLEEVRAVVGRSPEDRHATRRLRLAELGR